MADVIAYASLGIAGAVVAAGVIVWFRMGEARRAPWRRAFTGLHMAVGLLVLFGIGSSSCLERNGVDATDRAAFDRGFMKACNVPPGTEKTCRCTLDHLVATLGLGKMLKASRTDKRAMQRAARKAMARCEDSEPGAYQAVLAHGQRKCEQRATKAECACYYAKLAKRWPTAWSSITDPPTIAAHRALQRPMAEACGLTLTFPAAPKAHLAAAHAPPSPAPPPHAKPTPTQSRTGAGELH